MVGPSSPSQGNRVAGRWLMIINSIESKRLNEVDMSEKINESALQALKVAFSYMPKAIEVTKYEYGDRYQKVLQHIEAVREELLINDVDPEEVYGEINPENTPNSTY